MAICAKSPVSHTFTQFLDDFELELEKNPWVVLQKCPTDSNGPDLDAIIAIELSNDNETRQRAHICVEDSEHQKRWCKLYVIALFSEEQLAALVQDIGDVISRLDNFSVLASEDPVSVKPLRVTEDVPIHTPQSIVVTPWQIRALIGFDSWSLDYSAANHNETSHAVSTNIYPSLLLGGLWDALPWLQVQLQAKGGVAYFRKQSIWAPLFSSRLGFMGSWQAGQYLRLGGGLASFAMAVLRPRLFLSVLGVTGLVHYTAVPDRIDIDASVDVFPLGAIFLIGASKNPRPIAWNAALIIAYRVNSIVAINVALAHFGILGFGVEGFNQFFGSQASLTAGVGLCL